MSQSRKLRWDLNEIQFVDSSKNRWSISVELKAVKGRIVPVAVLVEPLDEPVELRTEVLREIALKKIVKPWIQRERDQLAHSHKKHRTQPHRGRPHSTVELQAVADVYQEAFAKSLPVQQAVAAALGISLSTAGKRIRAARQLGLLPPSRGGKR